jgi:hypothetical protein
MTGVLLRRVQATRPALKAMTITTSSMLTDSLSGAFLGPPHRLLWEHLGYGRWLTGIMSTARRRTAMPRRARLRWPHSPRAGGGSNPLLTEAAVAARVALALTSSSVMFSLLPQRLKDHLAARIQSAKAARGLAAIHYLPFVPQPRKRPRPFSQQYRADRLFESKALLRYPFCFDDPRLSDAREIGQPQPFCGMHVSIDPSTFAYRPWRGVYRALCSSPHLRAPDFEDTNQPILPYRAIAYAAFGLWA